MKLDYVIVVAGGCFGVSKTSLESGRCDVNVNEGGLLWRRF